MFDSTTLTRWSDRAREAVQAAWEDDGEDDEEVSASFMLFLLQALEVFFEMEK